MTVDSTGSTAPHRNYTVQAAQAARSDVSFRTERKPNDLRRESPVLDFLYGSEILELDRPRISNSRLYFGEDENRMKQAIFLTVALFLSGLALSGDQETKNGLLTDTACSKNVEKPEKASMHTKYVS